MEHDHASSSKEKEHDQNGKKRHYINFHILLHDICHAHDFSYCTSIKLRLGAIQLDGGVRDALPCEIDSFSYNPHSRQK